MYCSTNGKYYGGEGAVQETNHRCYKHWVNTDHQYDLAKCPEGSVIMGIDPYDTTKADNTGLEEVQFLCDKVITLEERP
jgi:hypothetical protein